MNLHARTLSSPIKSLQLLQSHHPITSFYRISLNFIRHRTMDRISFLPDHLLILIISFLTFREAARTSLLSRTWLNLWRQTQNIEFNESFFSFIGDNEERRAVFVNFVQDWIHTNENGVLDRVCLTFSRPGNFLVLVEECVRFAVRGGVKALSLDFSDPSWGDEQLENANHPSPAFSLPQFVNQLQAIESLTLSSCSFNLFDVINFRLMKNLALSWIEVPIHVLSPMLTNFPLLETLSLKNCWNSDGLQIIGDNLRLRSLVVEKFVIPENPWIEVQAPNLKCLKYSGSMIVFDINAAALEESWFEFQNDTVGNEGMGDLLFQLLQQLPSMTLTVCTYMLQVLPLEVISNGGIPVFGVAHLTLMTTLLTCEQRGIQYLLRRCPVLQALTLQIVPERIVLLEDGATENVGHAWAQNAPYYNCVSETLRIVQVRGYRGTGHEVDFLKYLIRHGLALQNIHLSISEELRDQRTAAETRRLVMGAFRGVRRASNSLRVNLCGI